ncbi:hypothetical protein G7Y79_00032g066620 [Physcia stellaris]|nr:hypothetical protein G7Y79_00032g066620 [Physcia stellaris]
MVNHKQWQSSIGMHHLTFIYIQEIADQEKRSNGSTVAIRVTTMVAPTGKEIIELAGPRKQGVVMPKDANTAMPDVGEAAAKEGEPDANEAAIDEPLFDNARDLPLALVSNEAAPPEIELQFTRGYHSFDENEVKFSKRICKASNIRTVKMSLEQWIQSEDSSGFAIITVVGNGWFAVTLRPPHREDADPNEGSKL